ncbi:arfaptin-1 isoform 2-T2 [Aplochiton taeniatus]
MSEVSVDAKLDKTSPEDLHMDCKEESHNTEESEEERDEDACSDIEVPYDDDDDDVYSDSNRFENVDNDVQNGNEEITLRDANAVFNGAGLPSSDSVDDGAEKENHLTETAESPKKNEDSHSQPKENTMAEEAHRSPAAEISVTSNGDPEDSNDDVFKRDPFPSGTGTLNHSDHSHLTSSNMASTTEGIIESGPYKGTMNEQPTSGAVVLADDLKNPAIEKLELVRKWSINTYKCTRQILSEKLGRGSRTVDLELEAQIDMLRDNKRKYEYVVKLAQTLANQLSQIMQTQRQLGDAFADLSLKSPELHEEFGYNADTQKLLSKNGETLLGAITFFIASVNTLVDKTIEDTMVNIKQYETARVEYDAYRTDLEELNLGPRDATTLPKIEHSQQQFQLHREKYEKMRNDVSVKLKFLEENKVKVLHNQLILFHNAIAAYYAGNQQQLEQTLKQFHIKLKMPGGDTPSWLEQP